MFPVGELMLSKSNIPGEKDISRPHRDRIVSAEMVSAQSHLYVLDGWIRYDHELSSLKKNLKC